MGVRAGVGSRVRMGAQVPARVPALAWVEVPAQVPATIAPLSPRSGEARCPGWGSPSCSCWPEWSWPPPGHRPPLLAESAVLHWSPCRAPLSHRERSFTPTVLPGVVDDDGVHNQPDECRWSVIVFRQGGQTNDN